MALHGLTLSTWIGWMFGVIVLQTPWGPPRLDSWLTFSVFYSLFFLFSHLFIIFDIIINSPRSLSLTETNVLSMWITRLDIILSVTTFIIFRIFMLVSAKKLANFMSQLHFYPLPKPSSTWKNRLFLESILVGVVYLTHYVALLLGMLNNVGTISHQTLHSFLGRSLGKIAYWIIFVILELLQQVALSNVSYAILLRFSMRSARIYQSFADDTVEILEELRQSWEENKHVQEKTAKGERLLEEDLKVKCARHQILVRFKKMQTIFDAGDTLMSPLLLSKFVTGTGTFIVSVSKAIVVNRSALAVIIDVLRAVNCWFLLGVYEIGEKANATIADGKLKIYQKYISISWESPHKAQLEGVVRHIQSWQWKLSAGGFFSVDRKLLKGILNIILTYVIIFFQMYVQLNLTPPSTTSCSKDGLNSTTVQTDSAYQNTTL